MEGQTLILHVSMHSPGNVLLRVCRDVREGDLSQIVDHLGAELNTGVQKDQDVGVFSGWTDSTLHVIVVGIASDVHDDPLQNERMNDRQHSGGEEHKESEDGGNFDFPAALPQERPSESEKLADAGLLLDFAVPGSGLGTLVRIDSISDGLLLGKSLPIFVSECIFQGLFSTHVCLSVF